MSFEIMPTLYFTQFKKDMCGILACFKSKYSYSQFSDAMHSMQHRGPDAHEIMNINEHFLGHHRLSIIDPFPRSNQPFIQGDDILIFNGEIYNYKELIKEHNLDVKGSSDTEVLICMYKKYGASCLQFLNGMFALIIYNKKKNTIFAARDRLGIKPLYFREEAGGGVSFSSEIAALLSLKSSPIDEFGLRQYLKLRMTVKGHTLYQDIRFFPPGYYYENGSFHNYWKLEVPDFNIPPSDEELSELIADSVRLRLRTDVPLGTYLSGGLDSTILSFLVKPEYTWTVGFENHNEFQWSTKANAILNSKLNTITVTKEEFLSTAKYLIAKRKEPLSVPNEVLIYKMTSEVRNKNKVVLSGEGADELFFGYDRIFRWAQDNPVFDMHGFDEKYSYGSKRDDEVLDFALSGVPGKTSLEKVSYYFQIIHLQGLLRRLDNSTMECSVEARVPFVDHRLVERLAGTPISWRMQNGNVKAPLKRIYENMIPSEIINRKKVGFPVPLADIYQQKTGESPMDSWLRSNIEILFNSN